MNGARKNSTQGYAAYAVARHTGLAMVFIFFAPLVEIMLRHLLTLVPAWTSTGAPWAKALAAALPILQVAKAGGFTWLVLRGLRHFLAAMDALASRRYIDRLNDEIEAAEARLIETSIALSSSPQWDEHNRIKQSSANAYAKEARDELVKRRNEAWGRIWELGGERIKDRGESEK